MTHFHNKSVSHVVRHTFRSLRDTWNTPKLKPRNRKEFSAAQRVAIAGIFSKKCGLQRAADLLYIDFKAKGLDVERYDITQFTGNNPDQQRSDTIALRTLLQSPPATIIFHAPPPVTARSLSFLGQSVYDIACMIGFWHWETPRAPKNWRAVANLMDEVWAPTPFVRDSLAAMDPALISRLKIHPNPIHADPFTKTSEPERAAARRDIGLRSDGFVAAFTFSAGSGYHRKNPIAVVEAFTAAFPLSEKRASLLLRCHDLHTYPRGYRELRKEVSSDPRITLFCDPKNRLPIRQFYAAMDTLVSLHRAEGFGLTIAEAMQSGAATIATDWGLAPELSANELVSTVSSRLIPIFDPQGFYEAAPDLLWADPDIGEASRALQKKFTDKYRSQVPI